MISLRDVWVAYIVISAIILLVCILPREKTQHDGKSSQMVARAFGANMPDKLATSIAGVTKRLTVVCMTMRQRIVVPRDNSSCEKADVYIAVPTLGTYEQGQAVYILEGDKGGSFAIPTNNIKE